jgi:hypothetical protein
MHVYLGKIGERKIHSLNSVDDHFRSIEVAYKGGEDVYMYIHIYIYVRTVYTYIHLHTYL